MNVTPVTVTAKNPPLQGAKNSQPKQNKMRVNAPMIGAIAGSAVAPHAIGSVLPHVLTGGFLEKIISGDKKTKMLYVVCMSAASAAIAGLGALAGKGIEKLVEKIKTPKTPANEPKVQTK